MDQHDHTEADDEGPGPPEARNVIRDPFGKRRLGFNELIRVVAGAHAGSSTMTSCWSSSTVVTRTLPDGST
jgi:hypothetical protein